jgi:hypothetical protein
MGFWGNTSQQPTKQKKYANINSDQLNSNQQAVPVKYLAGRHYVAGDWLTPAYNPVAKPVKTQTGKSETSTTGYKYYCDFALLFCTGGRHPVDAVYKVIVDSDIRWTGNVQRVPGVDFETITIDGLGPMNLYWGTETQAIDSILLTPRTITDPSTNPQDSTTFPANPPTGGAPVSGGVAAGDSNPYSGHYDHHPAYRGQCYAVFPGWFLGRDRTNVQNIQLELERGCPFFGTDIFCDPSGNGINPIAVLYDWLTDTRFGMGMADSQLNQQLFQAAYNALETSLLPGRISPVITTQDDFRKAIATLLEYFDGWIRRNGQIIEAGIWKRGTDVVSIATLTDDDLLHDPELEPQGWGPTVNEVTVVYHDKDHHYNDYVQRYNDPTNFRITGGPRPITYQRPWITDFNVAKTYARLVGAFMAMPYTHGTLTIKREWLTNNQVLPGIVFTYNSSFYGLSFFMRLYEIEYPADKAAEAVLTVEWERSKWPAIYLAPGVHGPGGFVSGPRAVFQSQMSEIPYLLADHAFLTQLVPFAVRGNVEVQGYRIWISFDGGNTYQIVPNASSTSMFGSMGLVNTAVGATDTTILTNLYGVDLDEVVTQTPAQQQDDTLLLMVAGEMMSVGTVNALGAGLYSISVLRGRYGTTANAYPVGQFMAFIYRDRLRLLDNTQFIPGTTIAYKYQPFTADADYDLTAIAPTPYTIIGFAPVPAPVLSPSAGAFVGSVTVSCSAAPAGFTTRYTIDGSPVLPVSPAWPGAGAGTLGFTGTTLVRVRFMAPTGRQSAEVSAQYTLTTGTAPQAQCSAPTWSFSGTLGSTGGYLTLTPTTAGSTTLYSLNGGATLTYSAPIYLNCTSTGDAVEFWATKSGLLDSTHTTVDNTKSKVYGGGDPGYGGGHLPP